MQVAQAPPLPPASDPILADLNRQLANAKQAVDAVRSGEQDGVMDPISWQLTSMPLSVGILVFGLIVMALMTYLIMKGKRPMAVLRSFCVPLIIVASLVLVIAGYGEQQIAPVMGLMGTIAGYLLGKSDNDPPTPVPQPAPPPSE